MLAAEQAAADHLRQPPIARIGITHPCRYCPQSHIIRGNLQQRAALLAVVMLASDVLNHGTQFGDQGV